MAFPTRLRLPLRFERERLSRQGERVSGRSISLVKAPSSLTASNPHPRFAVLVTKKVSPLSTERNHIKRLVSEATLSFLSDIPPADYLLIPKKNLLGVHYTDLLSDLKPLFFHGRTST